MDSDEISSAIFVRMYVVVEDIDHALFGVENSTEVAAKVRMYVCVCTYVHHINLI